MSSVWPGWEGGLIMKEWARYTQAEMGKMGCPFVCNVIILITGNVGEADDEDDEDDRELPHCNKKPMLMLDTRGRSTHLARSGCRWRDESLCIGPGGPEFPHNPLQ